MMYYYSGYTYQQIVDELNISIGTVKSRISSAKDKLSEKITGYEKKHGIALHQLPVFTNFADIIEGAGQAMTLPANML